MLKNNQEYKIKNLQLKETVNGDEYLAISLENRLGEKTGYCFENISYYKKNFKPGDIVLVSGKNVSKENKKFYKITKIRKNIPVLSKVKYIDKLECLMNGMKDKSCLKLLRAFANNEIFMKKFTTTVGSLSNHHNYEGGLLIHTVTSMEMGLKIYETYPDKNLNLDFLLTGLFLHDIGKIYIYTENGTISEYGESVGHENLGFKKFIDVAKEINLEKNYKLFFSNIILSHHYGGKKSFISTKPTSIEAYFVNKIEAFDSSLDMAS